VPLPAGPLLIEGGGSDARVVVGELLDAVLACELRGRRDLVLALRMPDPGAAIRGYRLLAARLAERAASYPLHLVASVGGERLDALIDASTLIGSLLCDGIGDSVEIQAPLGKGFGRRLAFQVLQAAGARVTKAEFVACPGCGRTLFDLESTTERIQRRTGHLTGVRIAVMGCIVNGPGEMADADFGYVGGAPGRVNLYVGKELVERNVAQEAAEERLEGLIRARGQWRERPV
jgi:(E)-4-hydroxy-3-methylbut-2-enyl-diphosphate synthase